MELSSNLVRSGIKYLICIKWLGKKITSQINDATIANILTCTEISSFPWPANIHSIHLKSILNKKSKQSSWNVQNVQSSKTKTLYTLSCLILKRTSAQAYQRTTEINIQHTLWAYIKIQLATTKVKHISSTVRSEYKYCVKTRKEKISSLL